MNILITGASGFVGKALLEFWRESDHFLIGTAQVLPVEPRTEEKSSPVDVGRGGVSQDAISSDVTSGCRERKSDRNEEKQKVNWVRVEELETAEWETMLKGMDAVVHLAARVHQMHDGPDAARLYHQTNVEGTRRLAEAAQQAGVKRFVFVSSIKAMGEETRPGTVWTEETPCRPLDAYGESKLAAEELLLDMHRKSGFPVVILRPPLMYGPGVKGNMASLMNLVARGWPIPVGGMDNRRSFLGVRNMASAIDAAVSHSAAPGKVFLVSDGAPISTAQLVTAMGDALGKKPLIVSLPGFLWRMGAALPFVGPRVRRLSGSLALSNARLCTELGWKPPFPMIDTLREAFGEGEK